jgi:Omp85 superfamily domain
MKAMKVFLLRVAAARMIVFLFLPYPADGIEFRSAAQPGSAARPPACLRHIISDLSCERVPRARRLNSMSLPYQAPAQSNTRHPDQANRPNRADQLLADLKARLSLTEDQVRRLRPLIERRIQTLHALLERYRGKGVVEIQALWNELLSQRSDFEKGLKEVLTEQQIEAFQAAHQDLVREMLSPLRDELISTLEQRLKLSEQQKPKLHAILNDDTERKLALLEKYRDQGTDAAAPVASELEVINQETRRHLTSLLTPEQLEEYRKLEQQARRSRLRLWSVMPSMAEMPGAVDAAQEDEHQAGNKTVAKKARGGEIVVAPIPIVNPTLENGLGIAAGYLYHQNKNDRVSPLSWGGIAGFRTSNGSWGFAAMHKGYFKEDRFRTLIGAGYVNVNYNLYGEGNAAGDTGLFLPINQTGFGMLTEVLVRIYHRWYAGLRYHYVKTKITLDPKQLIPPEKRPDLMIPEIELNLRTAALGPHIQLDSRDDTFYPKKGTLFDLRMDFYGPGVGGRLNYQSYNLAYNKYLTITPRQVLAFRGSSCITRGRAPFYDICLLGMSKDLRGYEVGRYRDRNMLSTQAEYRLEGPWRFGFVGFIGAGEVARKYNEFNAENLKPGGGVGVRFRLTKEAHVNLRVDYAWGKKSNALYISLGEAF